MERMLSGTPNQSDAPAAPARAGRLAAFFARPAVRRALFFAALAAVFWKPSSGFADAAFVLCGLRNAFLPHAFRPWRSPAGIFFLLGLAVLVAASAFGIAPGDSLRDAVKLLPLAIFVSTLPAWLLREGNLFRGIRGAAAVVTARLAVELARLAWVHGTGEALLEAARHTQPYLFTHPNVSGLTALLAAFAWGAACLKAKNVPARLAACSAGAFCLLFAYVMGSRGPQAAFAAVAFALPLLLLPGWKARAGWGALALLLVVPSVWAFSMLTRVSPKEFPPAARRIHRTMEAINPRFTDIKTLRHLNGRDVVWNHTDYLLKLEKREWRGYGYGKRVFKKAYYENPVQRAPMTRNGMRFPHVHSYWRQIRFEGGKGALACFALAWGAALWGGLVAFVRRRRAFAGKGFFACFASGALEAAVLAMASAILVYGGWDYPDSLLRILQYCLFAALLALPRRVPAAGR